MYKQKTFKVQWGNRPSLGQEMAVREFGWVVCMREEKGE